MTTTALDGEGKSVLCKAALLEVLELAGTVILDLVLQAM